MSQELRLRLVENTQPKCGGDARIIFLNGFVGREVRQGFFGGSAADNSRIKKRLLNERVTQVVDRYQKLKATTEDIDMVFVVGERRLQSHGAAEIIRRLEKRGIPIERLAFCGDASSLVEATQLFFYRAIEEYPGRGLRTHIATHPHWYDRTRHFLEEYDRHVSVGTFVLILQACFPTQERDGEEYTGYTPNISERIREWWRGDRWGGDKRNVQHDFHAFTKRTFLSHS